MKPHIEVSHRTDDGDGQTVRGASSMPAGSRVDLSQLAVRRHAGAETSTACSPPRRSHLLTRYVLPAVLLLGFLGLVGWSARESLLPARKVTVMPVLVARTEVQQAGTPLFQAAGWVEPRPTPIVVTALAEGVVERLLVVEDQEVEAGEPVAYLIDADAKLALEGTEAELALREADLARAQAALEAAGKRVDHPVHLEAPLTEAEAALAKAEKELGVLPALLAAAWAKERFARLDFEGKTAAGGALPQRQIDRAQSELETATAAIQELETRRERLQKEVAALSERRDTLRRRLELMIDEHGALSAAEAEVRAAEALVRQAQNAVDTARLRLERMVVRAPCDGRVLRLVAAPGTRVSGSSFPAQPGASTVVTLYDPQRLQLRTDVPLDQVPRVQVGQPVKIETESVPEGLEGEVLFKTAFTDLQKNTLDVKVAIKNPPADLKPDMLARVTFLAVPKPGADKEPTEKLRMLVPAALIEQGEGGSRVWVADQAASRARARTVKVGQPTGKGDLVEILDGLSETDKLIVGGREGLEDGERIAVSAEDATQGVEMAPRRGPSKGIRRIMPGSDAGA